MKKQILFLSLFISGISSAQTFTQANEPVVGNNVNMYVCDSNYTNYSSISGSNAVWDYSAITGYPGATKTLEIVAPSSTTYSSTFSSSTKVSKINGFISTFWNSSSSGRQSQGFVFTEATMGDIVGNYNANNESLINYPFSNSSSLSDTYSGTLSFTYLGQPQTPACTGTNTVTIDGQGTLIMPDGSSIPNVIRYKMSDHTTANIQFIGNVELLRTQFEYYNLSASNMPIFVHTNAVIQTVGSSSPMANISLVLSSVQPSGLNASVDQISNNNFVVYPNPSNGTLFVKGNFEQNTSISILDQAGRIVFQNDQLNNENTFDLNSIEKGIYTLSIIENGKISSKKIVLQ